MSALPPKADMCSASAHVRYGPIADMRLRTFVLETMVPEAVSVAASMTCINLIASVESQITTCRHDEHDCIRWCFNNHATGDAFATQIFRTWILPNGHRGQFLAGN